MKPNRSNKFTQGLVCTYEDTTQRSFFFELDSEHREYFQEVCDFYCAEELDFIVHRTGGGGFHFISPSLMSKGRWKFLHEQLKGINPKCPMTTLRIQPNKYPNEELVWYNSHVEKYNNVPAWNSKELCTYLNKIFGCKLEGTSHAQFKLVRYPLPLGKGDLPL
jgi:hypothetical protein